MESGDGTIWAWDLYATYQATTKLSFNLRGEYVVVNGEALDFGNVAISDIAGSNHIEDLTATVQYYLGRTLMSRVEFRWDHIEHGPAFGGNTPGSPDCNNAFMLALNVIYRFTQTCRAWPAPVGRASAKLSPRVSEKPASRGAGAADCWGWAS